MYVFVSKEVGEAEWLIDNIMGRGIGARERMFVPSTHCYIIVAGDGKPKCSYCRQFHSSVSCRTVTGVVQHGRAY